MNTGVDSTAETLFTSNVCLPDGMDTVHRNIIATNLPFSHTFRGPENHICYEMTIYVETGIREIYVRTLWAAFTQLLR
jgi:hypothetical protein